jgi:hypothetical protein
MLDFILGLIVATFGLLIIAAHIGAANKPKAKAQETSCNVIGLGPGDEMKEAHDYFLKGSIRQASHDKLYEIEFPTTRH